MQKLNNYIRYFKPNSPIGKNTLNRFERSFIKFNDFYKNHIPTNKLGYVTWCYEDNNNYFKLYDDLAKAIAEYLGIKVMFRDQLYIDQVSYGYLFIGDEQRICIGLHIFNHLYQLSLRYKDYYFNALKVAKQKNSSKLYTNFLQSIIKVVNIYLEVDLKYTWYIESYIQNNFKLDYKDYRTESIKYYHAISNKYKHKRMLL